jgi:surface antigen
MTDTQYKRWIARHYKVQSKNTNDKSRNSQIVLAKKQKKLHRDSIPGRLVPYKQKKYRRPSIVAKYWYKPNVSNGFYRGQCTRFVAIKKFPYITAHKQKKLWMGNARDWYKNAKRAGYPVGHTPRVGSIVVFKYGGRRYYYA